MKRIVCLAIAFSCLLCGCLTIHPAEESVLYSTSESTAPLTTAQHTDETQKTGVFTKKENGNLVSPSGVEYAHLANEGLLYYLGNLEFVGGVEGEAPTSIHLMYEYQTGMFAIEGDDSRNVLIRREPNNEWCSIYRKASLPEFDYSVDRCIRMELVDSWYFENDIKHATCTGGITDPAEIAAFLSEIRAQEDPESAGLYDLVRKPDGMFENCYNCATIYVYFEEEPYLIGQISIWSYNDLAYSVTLGNDSYVLPESWLQRFQDTMCTP